MDLNKMIEILKYSSRRTRKIDWKDADYTTPICDSMVRGLKHLKLDKYPPIPITAENISYIINNDNSDMFDWQRKYVYTIGYTEHTDPHLKPTPMLILDSIDDKEHNNKHITLIYKNKLKTSILTESQGENVTVYYKGHSDDNIQSWNQHENGAIIPRTLPKDYFNKLTPKNTTYSILKYQAKQVQIINPIDDYLSKLNETVM